MCAMDKNIRSVQLAQMVWNLIHWLDRAAIQKKRSMTASEQTPTLKIKYKKNIFICSV